MCWHTPLSDNKLPFMCQRNDWKTSSSIKSITYVSPQYILGKSLSSNFAWSPQRLQRRYSRFISQTGVWRASSTSWLTLVDDSKYLKDILDFIARLRPRMVRLRPVKASRHVKPTIFVFKQITTCSHIFLRDDTIRDALQSPYTGPHKWLIVMRKL